MQKTRPTLFKAEMVRAIKNTEVLSCPPRPIDPTEPFKSQTRRLRGLEEINGVPNSESWGRPDDWAFGRWVKGKAYFVKYENGNVRAIAPPLGVPGDFIYVREGWRYADQLVDGFERDLGYYIQFKSDGFIYRLLFDPGKEPTGVEALEYQGYHHKSTGESDWSTDKKFGKWKPSIHMFKYMSRFLLEIKEVRVERLQDITEMDAIAEGAIRSGFGAKFMGIDVGSLDNTLIPGGVKIAFSLGWDSINKKTGYDWNFNPWVFVYEFLVKEANV